MKTGKETVKKFAPVHPGKILLEEFLEPMEITQYRLAKEINVPARRINEIVHGERGITPDTSLRLAKFFGMSETFWLNLQNLYDVEVLKDQLQDVLRSIHSYSGMQKAS
ncbi:MAG: HigA family addiction module antitoxin [Bacteroidota bacterium]|jgi:addiction module HigA family antidote|nr:HigA family addiction module antidote protein [Ignavibacteria bacterium]HEX2925271.1 HigA family addiction module antitoxin [Ruminiclostridium sp.]MCU7501040.1 HigA family addiction module antidote protein [Ignavibacteria bacterium]MCU7514027.1 HigA family addiction module antidote protein [Ignavibacteria bacterium]MCU7521200.1 HigA family addiction module antidote protein [Ignavibacteria bacterium]